MESLVDGLSILYRKDLKKVCYLEKFKDNKTVVKNEVVEMANEKICALNILYQFEINNFELELETRHDLRL